MIIASFDIGIKNLAICVIEKSNETFSINYWNVISVIDDDQKVKNITTQNLVKNLIFCINDLHHNDGVFENIDEFIIELQPTVNPKMKMVSNTLYTILIDRFCCNENKNDNKIVKFFRAKNKLKVYCGQKIECKLKSDYSKRKFLSIQYTKYILNKLNMSSELIFFNDCKKKDDLADCFLQGLTYFGLSYS